MALPILYKSNKVVLGLALLFFTIAQLLTLFLLIRAWGNIHWYWTGCRLDLTDFSQFYQAGQLIISSNAHHVYDPDVQETWSLGLIYPHIPLKGLFYNQSVPFLYVFCIPYGLLPYNIAYVVWCVSTAFMALGGLSLLIKRSLAGLKNSASISFLFFLLSFSSSPCLS